MVEISRPERSLSRKSIAVLRTANALTPILLKEHPEIADLYRDPSLSWTDIANRVVPDLAAIFPSATRVAVINVIRELIPQEEREKISTQRRHELQKRTFNNMSDEEFKAHQREAARQRHLKASVDSEAMTRGRGIEPWTEHERMFAIFLSTQLDCQYPEGTRHRGLVNPNKVADALNSAFHNGESMRDRDSVRGFLNGWRKKNRESSAQVIEQAR